jgi:hypothetical protein
MVNDDINDVKQDLKPSERIAQLEARVAQLEAVAQAFAGYLMDMSSHQHGASGEVLVLPRKL